MSAGESASRRPEDAPQEPGGTGRRASPRRHLFVRLAQAAIVAATVYFLAAYLFRSWGSIQEFDWTFDAGWLAASGVAFLVFYFAQAGFWWLLLRGCGSSEPLLAGSVGVGQVDPRALRARQRLHVRRSRLDEPLPRAGRSSG